MKYIDIITDLKMSNDIALSYIKWLSEQNIDLKDNIKMFPKIPGFKFEVNKYILNEKKEGIHFFDKYFISLKQNLDSFKEILDLREYYYKIKEVTPFTKKELIELNKYLENVEKDGIIKLANDIIIESLSKKKILSNSELIKIIKEKYA